ncbi:MAG TPA: hypothetical protein VLR69_12305, partial [Thermoanaerobaculia bacterium]|nr:hypothetical protein [Thermoanaerobaculia bacterium]
MADRDYNRNDEERYRDRDRGLDQEGSRSQGGYGAQERGRDWENRGRDSENRGGRGYEEGRSWGSDRSYE